MITHNLFPTITGVLGLISAWLIYLYIKSSPEGEGKVKEISDEIESNYLLDSDSE